MDFYLLCIYRISILNSRSRSTRSRLKFPAIGHHYIEYHQEKHPKVIWKIQNISKIPLKSRETTPFSCCFKKIKTESTYSEQMKC